MQSFRLWHQSPRHKAGIFAYFLEDHEKVSNPHSRFQNFSLLEPKLLQGFINTPHDFRRRIKRTVDTGPCLGVFFCGQQFLQFLIFFFHSGRLLLKAFGSPPHPTYPARISCSSFVAFLSSCSSVFKIRIARIFSDTGFYLHR